MPSDTGLLPQQLTEHLIKMPLVSKTAMPVSQLQQQLPAVYYDIASLWLIPSTQQTSGSPLNAASLSNLSVDNIMAQIPPDQIYWQQLCVAQLPVNSATPQKFKVGQCVAEVVTLVKEKQLFLLYLSILPTHFAQLAKQNMPAAMLEYAILLTALFERLDQYGRAWQCQQVIADIYNPHLDALFRKQSFTVAKQQPQTNPLLPSKRVNRAIK